ncbi:DUF2256 domain-containing protein [Thiomicrospira sp. WB1]|uniref:DUF2256 domain-containing protein n=1 Tax=Thiomicrospira sp. WB1 TaxID=1685380 RepID=UPI000747B816|nr:DUF2256 domain-containing protein [Thiomicrospira sp. WB1]KUJ71077.1 hypothetical protein AVO41_09405 [Thiomicrospira sp. WB1]
MTHTPPADRPSKRCPVCERPFQWRKKWARDWDQVRYCSKRCRRQAKRLRRPCLQHVAAIYG